MNGLPVLYSRASCGPCRTVKQWFSHKAIEYEERNIDDSEYLKEMVNQTGVYAVPVVVWGREVVIGPNLRQLSTLLNSHR